MKNLKKFKKKIPVNMNAEKLTGILIHILFTASARIPISMILSKKMDSLAHEIQKEEQTDSWRHRGVRGVRDSGKQLLPCRGSGHPQRAPEQCA